MGVILKKVYLLTCINCLQNDFSKAKFIKRFPRARREPPPSHNDTQCAAPQDEEYEQHLA